MGMYDTVYFTCPNVECGKVIEQQSKAGECMLAGYGSNDVPPEIARGMIGSSVFCCECKSLWAVKGPEVVNVKLTLKKPGD